MTLADRTNAVLAKLREIAECKGVTEGPWIPTRRGCSNTGSTFDFIDSGDFACSAAELKFEDASFIARSRTITPAMAKALIVAIENLQKYAPTGYYGAEKTWPWVVLNSILKTLEESL